MRGDTGGHRLLPGCVCVSHWPQHGGLLTCTQHYTDHTDMLDLFHGFLKSQLKFDAVCIDNNVFR